MHLRYFLNQQWMICRRTRKQSLWSMWKSHKWRSPWSKFIRSLSFVLVPFATRSDSICFLVLQNVQPIGGKLFWQVRDDRLEWGSWRWHLLVSLCRCLKNLNAHFDRDSRRSNYLNPRESVWPTALPSFWSWHKGLALGMENTKLNTHLTADKIN